MRALAETPKSPSAYLRQHVPQQAPAITSATAGLGGLELSRYSATAALIAAVVMLVLVLPQRAAKA